MTLIQIGLNLIMQLYETWRIIHGRAEIWNFSSSVQRDISRMSAAKQWDIELNTRRKIPYLQASMSYFVYYINISLRGRSRFNSRVKKRMRGHSFMALNSASDVPAADWLPQTLVKNYHNFSRVVIRFFSEVEFPIKHSIYVIHVCVIPCLIFFLITCNILSFSSYFDRRKKASNQLPPERALKHHQSEVLRQARRTWLQGPSPRRKPSQLKTWLMGKSIYAVAFT